MPGNGVGPVKAAAQTDRAQNDTGAVLEDAVVAIDVLANDGNGSNKQLHSLNQGDLQLQTPAGVWVILASGARVRFQNDLLEYDAAALDHLAAGATLVDTFSYSMRLKNGVVSSATVTVTVTGTNDGPTAAADTASGSENQVLALNVLANDTDVDTGAVLSVIAASGPTGKGSVSIGGNQIQFNPGSSFDHLALGATEQVILSYTIADQHGATSTSSVTVTVTGTNDGPVANPDAVAGTENQILTIDALANDSDVDDGSVETLVSASAPAGKGIASIVAGQVQFNPGSDFDHLAQGATEQVAVSYTITDDHGATSTSTVTVAVTGTNDGPVANPDTAATVENASVTVAALANDTDVDDGAVKTLVAVTAPANKGSASIVANQVVFNPGADFDRLTQGVTEVVVLSYTMQDDRGAMSSSTISITVTGTNDGPVANADTATTSENASVTINVLGNDTDLDDGAILTVTDASVPAGQGSVAVVANQVQLNPGSHFDYLGVGETVNVVAGYTIQDAQGASANSTATFTIIGANDAPTIDAGGTTATGSVTELPNGDPGEGTTVHEADGVIAFDDVDLSDIHSAAAAAQSGGYLGTFTLDPVSQSGDTIAWHFDVSDADLDNIDEGEVITQTYTITISDGHGGTATQDVTVTLTGAAENAVPQAVADSVSTAEDVAVAIDILANDSDTDGDPLVPEIVSGPSHGSLTVDPLTGFYLYQPAPNYHGSDVFTYRISDPAGAQSDIVAVSITITSVNDPPLLTQTLTNQTGHVLDPVSITLPTNLVVDDDGGDAILYSAKLLGGESLPAWLIFDPETATFSGTPDSPDAGHYWIRVTGAEGDGQEASTSFILTIIDGNTIDGTEDGETINGTIQGDLIRAFGGWDTVNANTGADLVNGGAGNDVLNGQAGNDILHGGDDRDELRGGDGEDLLFGEAGNDRLYGGRDDDLLDGGDGDDLLEDREGGSNILLGGAGNDHLELFTFSGSQIGDGGSGDDVIIVYARRSPTTITTGEGSDRIHVAIPASFTPEGIITITDFIPGPGGDTFSLVGETANDAGLLTALSGWDGSSNPFGTGFLRLVQSGANTLLEWDQDGSGSNAAWTTLALFQNTDAANFTAANFAPGYNPDGSPPAGQVIVGSEDGDTINGSIGGDTISALGGWDTVNAGAGADLVNGGAGNDTLNGQAGDDILHGGDDRDELRGGDGEDLLFGEAGNDRLYGGRDDDLLDGGDGDDLLEDREGGSNTLLGGAGNDHLELFTFSGSQIGDGGSGDDVIIVYARRSPVTVTTGEGMDRLYVAIPASFTAEGVITITDFTPGPSGDNFSLLGETANDVGLLAALSGWDGSSNPFGAGFLRLLPTGADTLLQWDQDGPGSNAAWATLAVFQNTDVADFTEANFAPGYHPDGTPPAGETIIGTNNGETISGSIGGDAISALGGSDTVNAGSGADLVDGGAGNDTLNGQAGDDILHGGDDRDELRGGDGEDLLFGEAGNDRLYGGRDDDLLDGGDGDDLLEDREGGSNTLLGGAGNDHLELFTFSGSQIGDGGSGDDVIIVYARRSPTTVTTGEGADRIHVAIPASFTPEGIITITDFTPGSGGDNFSLVGELPNDPGLLAALSGWDGSSNPFGAGFLRLLQTGADTLLQWDQDGPGSNAAWATVAVFQNTDSTDFTDANFAPGYDPAAMNENASVNTMTAVEDILFDGPQAELEAIPSVSGDWFESGEPGAVSDSLGHIDGWSTLFTTDYV